MRRQDQFPGQLSDVGRTLAKVRRELAERAANLVPRLRRTDGTTAATLGTTWAWHDRSGNEIASEDTDAWGLGRPWLPIPMAPGLTFTNGSWSTVYRGTWQAQNPVVFAEFSLSAPATTTCQARLLIETDDGVQVQLGSTLTASAADAAASFTADPIAHGLSFGQAASLLLQVQRTAGAGTCTVWSKGLWGRQS
ncbi:hypothetical protein ACFWIB_14815 [Streptomyces sp. NPDC127051]|uniref:hypothetical protein n=1 Tax=Streptomyces sp. NPDC127051 TaxID=3347119 RepID=UPI0036565599